MSASLITHKTRQLFLRTKRVVRKVNGSLLGRPVLVNSFPKSGTHLVSQIFDKLPDIKDFGYFVTDATTWNFSPRDPEKMRSLVGSILPGELVRGHLRYDNQVSTILTEKNVVTYFAYRDLRDVVVSEVHYLTHMNRWHKLHRYFWELKNDLDAAIRLAICGLKDGGPTGLYRNIGARFQDFAGWCSDPTIYPIRFEDLVGSRRDHYVSRMLSYYLSDNNDEDLHVEHLIQATQSINASRSHTFRVGKIGQWEDAFSEENRALFKEFAGDLLIELGYENNYDW